MCLFSGSDLGARAAGICSMITDEHKLRIDAYPGAVGTSALLGAAGAGALGAVGALQSRVKSRRACLESQDGQLPSELENLVERRHVHPRQRKRVVRPGSGNHKAEEKETCDALLRELESRSAPGPHLSALELSSGSLDKHEKKKKKKKHKSGMESPSSDSSSESSFCLAALPKGVDRIHRMHQRKPGRLGSVTLQRCQEPILMSQGRGAASERALLPAVARAYLNLIFLKEHSSQSVGLRNLKETTTLATVIDYIAGNDPLRALDVLVQRMKALEVAFVQGNWGQASHLELVKVSDAASYFRRS